MRRGRRRNRLGDADGSAWGSVRHADLATRATPFGEGWRGYGTDMHRLLGVAILTVSTDLADDVPATTLVESRLRRLGERVVARAWVPPQSAPELRAQVIRWMTGYRCCDRVRRGSRARRGRGRTADGHEGRARSRMLREHPRVRDAGVAHRARRGTRAHRAGAAVIRAAVVRAADDRFRGAYDDQQDRGHRRLAFGPIGTPLLDLRAGGRRGLWAFAVACIAGVSAMAALAVNVAGHETPTVAHDDQSEATPIAPLRASRRGERAGRGGCPTACSGRDAPGEPQVEPRARASPGARAYPCSTAARTGEGAGGARGHSRSGRRRHVHAGELCTPWKRARMLHAVSSTRRQARPGADREYDVADPSAGSRLPQSSVDRRCGSHFGRGRGRWLGHEGDGARIPRGRRRALRCGACPRTDVPRDGRRWNVRLSHRAQARLTRTPSRVGEHRTRSSSASRETPRHVQALRSGGYAAPAR